MSTFYEVALFGEFFQSDFQAILNRFTLHSESARKMHSQEIIFEPVEAVAQTVDAATPIQRTAKIAPVQLRCMRELLEPDSGWVMFSHLKAEPGARIQGASEATIRPTVVCNVTGDATRFASALGYVKTVEFHKRGYIFRRGPLSIRMFQIDPIDPKTLKPIPAHADAPWQVEVLTTPTRNTQETPLSHMVDAALEVQRLMKGLLDLQKRDS
ncbi:hypothetical protein M422DRAFT_231693 [Sphaerobolus stellatus SS14]|uniref:Mediator of RNA polymerase II transcription subunit 18 n=1 Tax=Sphaerobolus stellatus (strain SS14) TaxID=990650 RepID=A0A0C9VJ68_SPHS4|nr:hypothetical protein M422DRAFT_231693 [Sphaerobolus stellatus SS14]